MKSREKLIGIAVLGALAMNAAPAFAQVEEGRHEVHVYGGQTFGDDLTDRTVSGRTPQLDDDFTYGFRYGYSVTRYFGLELAVGETATSATHLATRDTDLDLTTLDLDAVWNFNTGSPLVPYALAGIGYATADLDRPIVGTVNGQPVRIGDDNGFTLNAGAGLKYFVSVPGEKKRQN